MTIQRVSSGLSVVKARRLGNLAVVVAIACTAVIACGDDDPAATEPTPDEGTTSSSTSSSSSSGDNGPKPGSSSGDPDETVNCDAPTKQAACTLDAYFAYDVDLVTDKDCKTSLYVAGKATTEASDFKTRRYTLKTLDPCVFEKDTTFTDLDSSDTIAVNEAGDIVSVGTKKVELIRGQSRIQCDGDLPAETTHFAVMNREGDAAFLGHYANVNEKATNISISKVTITGETCAVAKFPLTGGDAITGLNGFAVDTKGRLHVADTSYPKGADRIVVYDKEGTFVSTYKGNDNELYFSPTSVTPCKGGICVDGFGSVFSFDENGIQRGHAKLQSKEELETLIRYVGSTRGPFFLVGNNGVDPRHIVVNAMPRP